MPIVRCQKNNKKGFKVQNANKCFTYGDSKLSKSMAKARAKEQLKAIKAKQNG